MSKDKQTNKRTNKLLDNLLPLSTQAFDGWELNGNVFPSPEDHGLTLGQVRRGGGEEGEEKEGKGLEEEGSGGGRGGGIGVGGTETSKKKKIEGLEEQ